MSAWRIDRVVVASRLTGKQAKNDSNHRSGNRVVVICSKVSSHPLHLPLYPDGIIAELGDTRRTDETVKEWEVGDDRRFEDHDVCVEVVVAVAPPLHLPRPNPDGDTGLHLMVLEVDRVAPAPSGAVDEDVEPHKLDGRTVETVSINAFSDRSTNERCVGHVHCSTETHLDDITHGAGVCQRIVRF